jgi:hypothetical protein
MTSATPAQVAPTRRRAMGLDFDGQDTVFSLSQGGDGQPRQRGFRGARAIPLASTKTADAILDHMRRFGLRVQL